MSLVTAFVHISPGWLIGPYTCLECSHIQTPALIVFLSQQLFFLNQQAHLLKKHSQTLTRKCWCLPLISETLTVWGAH